MTESYPGHTEDREIRNDSGKAELAPSPLDLDLNALKKREALACPPDELVDTTWEQEWNREA